MIDPLDTEGEEQRKQTRADKAQLAVLREAEDIKWLMSSKRGRRIVSRLLHQAGDNRTSFHTNALQMSFNEGHRAMALFIKTTVLEICPGRYVEMIEEAQSDD